MPYHIDHAFLYKTCDDIWMEVKPSSCCFFQRHGTRSVSSMYTPRRHCLLATSMNLRLAQRGERIKLFRPPIKHFTWIPQIMDHIHLRYCSLHKYQIVPQFHFGSTTRCSIWRVIGETALVRCQKHRNHHELWWLKGRLRFCGKMIWNISVLFLQMSWPGGSVISSHNLKGYMLSVLENLHYNTKKSPYSSTLKRQHLGSYRWK